MGGGGSSPPFRPSSQAPVPPAGTNPAGHPCSSVRPAAIPAAKQGPATGAAGQPLGSWQKPARKVPYHAASPTIFIPPERTGAASSTAKRSAVPGWICSTERVAVSLNSCLTKQEIKVLCGKFRITGKRPAYSCRFLSFCCNLAATLAISWRSASVIPVDTCTSSAGLSPAESRTKTAALVFPAMACATCASVIAS